MPDVAAKRGKRRVRARVMVNGQTRARWWPDDSRRSMREAVLWEAEVRKELENAPPTPTASLTVIEWATAYLDESKRRHAVKTYHEKRDGFKRFLRAAGPHTPIEDVTVQLAGRYLAEQHDTRSGNAANKDRKNLARAWAFGVKMMPGFPAGNPFLEIERFPEHREPRYIPPEEDYWAVYEAAEGQDKVILLTFLHLGARRGEIWKLRWVDLDLIGGQVSLRTSKREGGDSELDILPLTQELKETLLWWWEARPVKSPYVFVSLGEGLFSKEYYGEPFTQRRHFMKSICRKAGVKHFGFHAIRHLTASILYHEGYPVATIQAILRHKSAATTERYLKRLGMDPTKAALQEAMGKRGKGGPAKILQMK